MKMNKLKKKIEDKFNPFFPKIIVIQEFQYILIAAEDIRNLSTDFYRTKQEKIAWKRSWKLDQIIKTGRRSWW